MRRLVPTLTVWAMVAAATVGSAGAVAAADPPTPGFGLRPSRPLDVVRSPEDVPARAGRAIALHRDRIELRDGPDLVRSVPFAGTATVGLEAVVAAVADPTWVAAEDGVVTLSASLAQGPGTSLVVGPPAVVELRLVTHPGLFVGGTEATARYDGVRVTSWADAGPDRRGADGRPYLLYEDGSRLDVVGSELTHLGHDAPGAHGLSVRRGSSGAVTGSKLLSNHVGFTASEAKDVVVRATAVRNSGGDGVVLDRVAGVKKVIGNRIEGNGADGIVLLRSSHVDAGNNLLRDNRVGIRIASGSDGVRISGNEIVRNRVGVELYPDVAGTLLADNEVADSLDIGMVLDGRETVLRGGEVRGVDLGLDVRGTVDTREVHLSRVGRGMRVGPDAVLDADGLEIDATRSAVDLEPGATARVRHSVLDAGDGGDAVRGGELALSEGNVIPLAFPWLSAVGLVLLLMAVGLEVLRRLRDRRGPHAPVPPGVWNTT